MDLPSPLLATPSHDEDGDDDVDGDEDDGDEDGDEDDVVVDDVVDDGDEIFSSPCSTFT